MIIHKNMSIIPELSTMISAMRVARVSRMYGKSVSWACGISLVMWSR